MGNPCIEKERCENNRWKGRTALGRRDGVRSEPESNVEKKRHPLQQRNPRRRQHLKED